MPWRTIDVELRAHIAGFRAQMGAAGAAVQDFARTTAAGITGAGKSATELHASAERMGQVGGILTRSVTVPLVLAGAASVKFAADFETTFSRIAGLTDIPAEQIGHLREQVLSLAGDTARSPQELAEGLYLAASAGLDADQALAVVTTSAKAAAAGMGDTATVVDLVTGVVNAYGAANITAAQATDILTAAVRTGKAEPDAFANTLGRVLPLASQLGVGFDQVAAAVATLTNGSIEADVAATGLRQVFSDILQPGKQAEVQLRAIGINSEQLRQTLRDQGLLAALGLLKTQMGGNQEAVGKIIPDIRALTTVLSLMGQDSDRVAAIFDATRNSTGSLDSAFQEFQKTNASKLKQALVDNQVALIKLGDALVPLAADLLPRVSDAVTGIVGAFTSLPDPVQTAIIAVGGIAALSGPLFTLGANLQRLRLFFTGPAGVAEGAEKAAGSVGRFRGAMGAITVTAGMALVADWVGKQADRWHHGTIAVEQLGEDLLDFGQKGVAAGELTKQFGTDLEDLKHKIDLAGRSHLEQILRGGTIRQGQSSVRDAKADIDALDKSLASLVSSGHRDAAGLIFKGLADAVVAQGGSVKDLRKILNDYRGALASADTQTKLNTADTEDNAAAVGGLTTDYTAAAEAAKTWADSLGGFTSALDAADAADHYADSVDNLNDVMAEDPSEEVARGRRAVTAATDDAARSAEHAADADKALAEAIAGVTDAERESLELARDQAAERQRQAHRDVTDAQKHLDNLIAAGRSPKAIQDATDAVTEATLASRQADEDATKAQQALDDTRVGSPAYAKKVADAERDARDAHNQVADATDRVAQAEREAKTPAEALAAHQRKVGAAMRDVAQAALDLQTANIAAGITPATAATGALIEKLQLLRDQWPTLAGPINDLILKLNGPNGLPAGTKVVPPEYQGPLLPNEVRAQGPPKPPDYVAPPAPNTQGAAIVHGRAGGGGIGGSGGGWYMLGDEGTHPELLHLAAGSSGRVYSNAQTRRMLGGAHRMAAGGPIGGGYFGPRMAVDSGRSRVEVVRVVERHETRAPTYNLHGGDARAQVRELETMRRREQISRSLSDASANDWTR